MSYKVSVSLRQLVSLNPKAARRALLKHLREHDGQPLKVVEATGVPHSTLKRWIDQFDLREDVEKIRAAAGLKPARTEARAGRGQLTVEA